MNHIQSPDTSDAGIEREILAKGLTAPRVTPADIEENINAEIYFTAFDALMGASGEDISLLHDADALKLLTHCVLVLSNGFTVTGESACASPENFDAEMGRKIARANAISKVWPLMGYALKERLHAATPNAAQAEESALPPYQQRVIDEYTALEVSRGKLKEFLSTPLFHVLMESEQSRLLRQGVAMRSYSEILAERIAAF